MSMILGGTPGGPVAGGGPVASLVSLVGSGFKAVTGSLLAVTVGTVVSTRQVASMTQVSLDASPDVIVPARSLGTRWPKGSRVWLLALTPRTYLILGSASDLTGRPPAIRPYTAVLGLQDYVPPTDGIPIALLVECIGGGGAGGTTTATGVGQTSSAGGGQGGQYSRRILVGTDIPLTTQTNFVGVSAGGASNPAAAGTGGSGGFSFFGTNVSADGGSGGAGGGAAADTSFTSQAGGEGAQSGVGSILIQGSTGGMGQRLNTQYARGGFGGHSHMSGSQRCSTGTTSAGFSGLLYGGGGSGAQAGASQAIQQGGAGAQGGVWVTFFFV